MRRVSHRFIKGKVFCVALIAAVLGVTQFLGDFGGYIPAGQAKSTHIEQCRLMPVGAAVGIHIQTKGLLVLGTAEVTDAFGNKISPAQKAVSEGDYIIKADGKAVSTAAQMTEIIREKKGGAIALTVNRDGNEVETSVNLVKTKSGDYKTGIWVRDDTQGIGTLSFVDENNCFAALGHGITDVDTGGLVDMSMGGLYPSSVYAIVRGKSGKPGEMVGNIIYGQDKQFGRVSQNTAHGIFGQLLTKKYAYDDKKALPAAGKNEMHIGEAKLMCEINGSVDSYTVKIVGIDYNGGQGSKDFVLQITDERLKEKTGGIVQGMSGSPIIQDGKFVGALTHVFVNDPLKGYGIFIEGMLEYRQIP